jgi:hypothetical protein
MNSPLKWAIKETHHKIEKFKTSQQYYAKATKLHKLQNKNRLLTLKERENVLDGLF